MKSSIISYFLLGCLSLTSSAQNQIGYNPPPGCGTDSRGRSSKKLDEFCKEWMCEKHVDGKHDPIPKQCAKACPEYKSGNSNKKISSVSCGFSGDWYSFNGGNKLTKEQVDKKVPGKMLGWCLCDDPIVNFVGEKIMDSLEELGKAISEVWCPTLMALDLVVEAGSAALPGVGKMVTTGMKTSIKTAKMMNYAYDAGEAAMEFATLFLDPGLGFASQAGCSTPSSLTKEALAKTFPDLVKVSDDIIGGMDYDKIPCPKKKKGSKKCDEKNGKKPDDDKKPDDKKPDDKKDKEEKERKEKEEKERKEREENEKQNKLPGVHNMNLAAAARKDALRLKGKLSGSGDLFSMELGEEEADIDDALTFELDLDDEEELEGEGQRNSTKRLRRHSRKMLHARRLLVAREDFSPKSGFVCRKMKPGGKTAFPGTGILVSSFKYPRSGHKLVTGHDAYAFTTPDDFEDYRWGVQQARGKDLYDTEHVLEWSMVVFFFRDLEKTPGPFAHPDPEYLELSDPKDPKSKLQRPKNLNWCKYWEASWAWDSDSPTIVKMSNPNPNAQVAAKDTKKRTPFEWLAKEFPHQDGSSDKAEKAYEDELILLQKNINSHNKANLFKDEGYILEPDEMNEKIKGVTKTGKPVKQPKKKQKLGVTFDPKEEQKIALLRLKQTVGTFLYLREKKVNDILVKQVDRIGKQLENIENALAKEPRKEIRKNPVVPGTNGPPDRDVVFDPWKKMDLKGLWFKYMTNIHTTRKAEAWRMMPEWIKELRDFFSDSKFNKLKADIEKEKKSNKPNPNALKPMEEEFDYQEKMRKGIDKVEAEWAKARDWPLPGWNK